MGPHANPYGPEVLESNPPLAIWLSAVVVAMGRLLHLPVTLVFKTLVTLLAGVSGAVCFSVLRTMQAADPNRFPAATRANDWILAFVWTVMFGVLPARDFGQRDHVLALLVLPYLITAARPLVPEAGTWPWLARLGVAAVAGVGVALKPHHLLIPVAVELLVLVKSRRLRLLEPTVFLLAGVAYLSAIQAAGAHVPDRGAAAGARHLLGFWTADASADVSCRQGAACAGADYGCPVPLARSPSTRCRPC